MADLRQPKQSRLIPPYYLEHQREEEYVRNTEASAIFVRGGYYYILTNTTAVLMFGSYNKLVYSGNGGCLI